MREITLTKYQLELLQPYLNARRDAEIALQNQLGLIIGEPYKQYRLDEGVLQYEELKHNETNTKQQ